MPILVSENLNRIVCGEENKISVYDITSGIPQTIHTINQNVSVFFNVNIDVTILSNLSGEHFSYLVKNEDKFEVCIFDLKNLKLSAQFPVKIKEPCYLSLSPDGTKVSMIDYSKCTLLIYDSGTGEVLNKWDSENINTQPLDWSPDGKLICACDTDQGGGNIFLFNPSGKFDEQAIENGFYDTYFYPKFSGMGNLVAVSTYNLLNFEIHLFDLDSRKLNWLVKIDENDYGDELPAKVFRFFNNDTHIVVITQGGFKILEVSTGNELAVIPCKDNIDDFEVDGTGNVWYLKDGIPVNIEIPEF